MGRRFLLLYFFQNLYISIYKIIICFCLLGYDIIETSYKSNISEGVKVYLTVY